MLLFIWGCPCLIPRPFMIRYFYHVFTQLVLCISAENQRDVQSKTIVQLYNSCWGCNSSQTETETTTQTSTGLRHQSPQSAADIPPLPDIWEVSRISIVAHCHPQIWIIVIKIQLSSSQPHDKYQESLWQGSVGVGRNWCDQPCVLNVLRV